MVEIRIGGTVSGTEYRIDLYPEQDQFHAYVFRNQEQIYDFSKVPERSVGSLTSALLHKIMKKEGKEDD